MTETEWNESTNVNKMLSFVKDERKKRLFACACVRQVWHLLTDDRSKQAVIVSEQFADGLVSKEELRKARTAAWVAAKADGPLASSAWAAVSADAYWAAKYAAYAAKVSITTYIPLLKDIFDPFKKYKQPQCNNYTKEFARTIYDNPNEKGELLDLHVLADMLIDQNVDQVLVDHLRSGVHVRGCQVMDLVMHN